MPAGLAEVVAPLAERGQNVIDGDVEMPAGTRIARIKGLVASGFGAMPPGTFFGNLFDTVEPGRPFDGNIIAGDGLTFDLHIKNGPFPEIVGETQQAFPTAVTTVTHNLAIVPIIGDRVLIATQHNGSNAVTTPTGYTLVANVLLTDATVSLFERVNCDGTEGIEVDIVASVAGAVLVKSWVVRYSHPSIGSQTSTGIAANPTDLTNNAPILTPTWGISNILWLSFLGCETDGGPPNVTVFPGGFSGEGELQNTSATASLDGTIAWGFFNARLASLDPSAYTYVGASRSAQFLIAVPPREAYAINATPGGGAGWDDVLLVDNHSGASNPIVDAPQYIQFGAGSMPASGQIRTDSIWEARGTKDMSITSAEAIHLSSVDSSDFICSGGQINIQSDLTLKLKSVSSSMTLDSANNITATATNNITLTGGSSTGVLSGSASDVTFTATDDILLNAADALTLNAAGVTQLRSTGASGTVFVLADLASVQVRALASTVSLIADVSQVLITPGTSARINGAGSFLQIAGKAASTPTVVGSDGMFWVKTNTPTDPFFTDDSNTDRQIATFPIPLSGFATIANDTVLGNISGSTAVPSAVSLSSLTGTGLTFTAHQITWPGVEVWDGGGTSQGKFQILDLRSQTSIIMDGGAFAGSRWQVRPKRAALTGAITAAQDDNTTAFGALAAKSVLANATNASGVPAALAGSTAFQHLRVNSANTGLEWSVFTTGDFPNSSVPVAALANIGADTFLGNVTGVSAAVTANSLTTLAGAGLTYSAGVMAVGAGGGGSLVVGANDVQRAALTGAITASQDSNATSFGALAAKSVLANATNASAVPAALAGSAAFQHLRVNSANTGLEWSVFTSGDFPAGVVPLTAIATQAANTIVANASGVTATPTAVTCGAESVFGQTSGNLQGIASSVQTALIRGSGSVFWASAAADQVLRRSGTGDLGFGTLVTNNIGSNQITNALLARVATDTFKGNISGATANVSDVALTSIDSTSIIYDGTSHTFQRAALTGDVTATQNSNAMTIANGVVSNAKLATMAALTLKVNLTGATAAPTDSSLSATLDALVSSNQRVFLGRDAGGWGEIFQTDGLAHLNLPTVGGGCTVPWVDEDFRHLVVSSLGSSSGFPDVFVGITNGQSSGWYFGPESGGTATCSAVADTAGHNGIVQLSSGTASGNDVTLFNGQQIRFDRTSFADFWVKLSATTTETFRVGLMQQDTATSGGTDSAMFQFDPAVNANYQCITRSASGTATTTTTGSAGSTLWKKFTIWRESSTSVRFFINNTAAATHTTAIPSILLSIGCYLKTNTAAARTMQVDRIRVYADDATLLT